MSASRPAPPARLLLGCVLQLLTCLLQVGLFVLGAALDLGIGIPGRFARRPLSLALGGLAAFMALSCLLTRITSSPAGARLPPRWRELWPTRALHRLLAARGPRRFSKKLAGQPDEVNSGRT
jgi:hypothetical protein